MKRSPKWIQAIVIAAMLTPAIGAPATPATTAYRTAPPVPEQSSCPGCEELLNAGTTRLTVGYALPGGGSVMLWLGRDGRRAFGQSYTAAGLPRGSEFMILLTADDGLLPIVFPQPDGGFILRWKRPRGDRLQIVEQRYDADGTPFGDIVRRDR